MARDYTKCMWKSVDEICKDVRLRLDMNQEDSGLEGIEDSDTLNLNDIIKAKMVEGVRLVEMNASLEMFDCVSVIPKTTATITWETKRTSNVGGKITLPDDFMRLMLFKMSDWDVYVTEPVDFDSEEYKKQKSKWGGVRGNTEDPVVVIVPGNEKVLEFYSCDTKTATIETALYVDEPKVMEKVEPNDNQPTETDDNNQPTETAGTNEGTDGATTGSGSEDDIETQDADGVAGDDATNDGEPGGDETSEGDAGDDTEEPEMGMYLQKRLYQSCVYEIARLVALTIGDDNMAQKADAVGNELLMGSDKASTAEVEG